MAITGSQVEERARIALNDSDASAYRWESTVILGYLNAAMTTMRVRRPDLFFADLSADPTISGLSETLAIDSIYLQALADYVVARCHSTNNEAASQTLMNVALQFAGGVA